MSVIGLNAEDGIATITLNRPEAKNAINQAVALKPLGQGHW